MNTRSPRVDGVTTCDELSPKSYSFECRCGERFEVELRYRGRETKTLRYAVRSLVRIAAGWTLGERDVVVCPRCSGH